MGIAVKYIWPVNLRLEEKLKTKNTKARKWIWERAIPFVVKKENENENLKGVYEYLEDGTLVFLGLKSKQFPYTFGYFPKEFPVDDEFQPIYKGMKAEEFEMFLKTIGFTKISD